MNTTVLTKTYSAPPFSEKEILRYMMCKDISGDIKKNIRRCMEETKEKIVYKVCYGIFPLKCKNGVCDFEALSLKSKLLEKNLAGCNEAIIFSATVGIDLDRMISLFSGISPSKALILQALGAERIEALCDTFCADMEKEKNIFLRSRFSPGYGDLSLTAQKDIFSVLNPQKNIGLFLSDTMMMSPSKSVTAIAGISEKGCNEKEEKCGKCNKKDCLFRGDI